MIYQFDQALPMPTKDLYDTSVMQMAITAAKDMYNRGEKRIDDFYDKYGDFYSPIASDVDYVHNETIGKLNEALDYMQANGIDPLRSSEGRALVQQAIRSVNAKEIANRKQAAVNAQTYQKMRAELQAKGLYSEDLERYILGGKTLEEWDTAKDGLWTTTSPTMYKSMDDIIEPLVKNLEPIFDENLTKLKNNGKNYYTVSDDRIRSVIDDNLKDLTMNKTIGGYYYNQALQATGGDEAKALELLKDWYVNRAKDHVRSKEETDPYAMANYNAELQAKLDGIRTNNDIRAAEKQAEIKYRYDTKALLDSNRDGIISDEERQNYADFVEAERLYQTGGDPTGSGSTNSSIPDVGSATALSVQQTLDYTQKRKDYISGVQNKNKQEEHELYSKLTDSDKKQADLYKQYKNSDSPIAKKQLEKIERKKDPRFIAWKQKYLESIADETSIWERESTTQGKAEHGVQTAEQLYNRSNEIFENYNRVTTLQSEQYKDLNKWLNYTVDEESGTVTGNVDSSRNFAPIDIAKMTGNRGYRYESTVKRVNRIIQGKEFVVTPDSSKSRKYGSGTIKDRRTNIIVDTVTFNDKSVIDQLNKIPESELNKFGIEKIVENGETTGYKIPISTTRQHGFGWASIDTASDERVGGKSEASKKSSTRQAQQLTNIAKEE